MNTKIFLSITVVSIVILLLLLWRQQAELARIKSDYNQLKAQKLAALPPTPTTPVQPSEPTSSTQDIAVTAAPVTHPAAPEKNRLLYVGTEINQTSNGLVAIMRFKPNKTGPLGLVAMSVRLANSSETTIQTIAPVGPANYEDSDSTVSEGGRFAFFQGTLGDEKEVQIALGVSGSAQAFIKGSCGINAFQLDIQPRNPVGSEQ
jgi:hypothetical protein